ncbi:MAG: OmpA family protein [Treponema sp.]|nr:OmpA family protein [Treponema sp.]
MLAAFPFMPCTAAESKQPVITSTSSIDWTTNTFTSAVSLNTEKALISLPSGKNAALGRIKTSLPTLIKDPLLSIYVNSDTSLSDMVLSENLTLEQITNIIDEGKRTPGVFANGSQDLQVIHTINLLEISSLMVRHHMPYKPPRPIQTPASRAYSGIIIDARGSHPVHGEFVSDDTYPCFFPNVWDEEMNLIYERNMSDAAFQRKSGLVLYDWSDDESRYADRVGIDPMRISARKVYGRLRTDPIISHADALKILSVPENIELLKAGKVVILLDKDKLIHGVSAPVKDESYYTAYRKIKQHVFENEEPPEIFDSGTGIELRYDLKFVADSPELLADQKPKIEELAELLSFINRDNAYTILVEGHTADINRPVGQMRLSIERTKTVIDELVKSGLPREIFSFRGYGGTEPIADNATAEGRAENRRVIITARPKQTYIQQY